MMLLTLLLSLLLSRNLVVVPFVVVVADVDAAVVLAKTNSNALCFPKTASVLRHCLILGDKK